MSYLFFFLLMICGRNWNFLQLYPVNICYQLLFVSRLVQRSARYCDDCGTVHFLKSSIDICIYLQLYIRIRGRIWRSMWQREKNWWRLLWRQKAWCWWWRRSKVWYYFWIWCGWSKVCCCKWCENITVENIFIWKHNLPRYPSSNVDDFEQDFTFLSLWHPF